MKKFVYSFYCDEEGGVSAEFIIILGIVAMIAIVFGPRLLDSFNSHTDCMDNSSKKALNNHNGIVGSNC